MIPKTLATKVFLTILVTCLVSETLICAFVYHSWSSRNQIEFARRYETLAKELATTLTLMEATTDRLMLSAARHLSYRISKQGIPSNAELKELATSYGVTDFFITDDKGFFIRTTNLNSLPRSILDFCPHYKDFLTHGGLLEQTPIVYSSQGASKFTMIPVHENGGGIVESGMHVEYLGDALEKAARADGNTLSLGVYTPSGQPLGFFPQGSKANEKPGPLPDVRTGTYHSVGPEEAVFFSKVPSNCNTCCECKEKGSVDADGKYYYVLKATVSSAPLVAANKDLKTKVLFIFIFVFLFTLVVSKYIAKILVRRLGRISEVMRRINQTKDLSTRLNDNSKDELGELSRTFDSMTRSLSETQLELLEREKDVAIATTARQVAHDIRSPLCALEMGCSLLQQSREQQSAVQIMKSALIRIKEIANNLDQKSREQDDEKDEGPHLCSMASLVEGVVTEKKLQYKNRRSILISFDFSWKEAILFARIEPDNFKRTLSNLVDNSVEAIGKTGKVSLSVRKKGDQIVLRIGDSGCGIAKDHIKKIGTKGVTFGKKGGNGLGLAFAKKTVDACGGRIKILSKQDKGTVIRISLPLQAPPEWFADKLQVSLNGPVVVVDDDPSIHEVWRYLISSSFYRDDVEILSFYSPRELQQFLALEPHVQRNGTFLVDYDFALQNGTGIDLFQGLIPPERSILVTSHSESHKVIRLCQEQQIKILPKSLIKIFPVSFDMDGFRDEKQRLESRRASRLTEKRI